MIPVGIVGFSGYSGAELVHLLSRHPHVEPVLLEHRETDPQPRPLNYQGPKRTPYSEAAGLPLVFLATPPEVSIELTPDLLRAGTKVNRFKRRLPLGHDPETIAAGISQKLIRSPICCAEAAYALPEFYLAPPISRKAFYSRIPAAILRTPTSRSRGPHCEAPGVIDPAGGCGVRRQVRCQRSRTQALLKDEHLVRSH